MATGIIPSAAASGATLIWENSNVDTTFTGQTISLDLSPYKLIIIFTAGLNKRAHSTGENQYNSWVTFVPHSGEPNVFNLMSALWAGGSGLYIANRGTTVTETSITFANATYGASSGSTNTNNDACVPYRIYGIK